MHLKAYFVSTLERRQRNPGLGPTTGSRALPKQPRPAQGCSLRSAAEEGLGKAWARLALETLHLGEEGWSRAPPRQSYLRAGRPRFKLARATELSWAHGVVSRVN